MYLLTKWVRVASAANHPPRPPTLALTTAGVVYAAMLLAIQPRAAVQRRADASLGRLRLSSGRGGRCQAMEYGRSTGGCTRVCHHTY